MKIIVISYSLTGNNQALATSIAATLEVKHIKIVESDTRNLGTIVTDLLFNRTPKVSPITDNLESNDLIIFVGPVWMGHVATPLRAYFEQIKTKPARYAFISISGGADGQNPKLAAELKKRTGKEPSALIDLHIADLLPAEQQAKREDTSAYRINDNDVKRLTDAAVEALQKILIKQTIF